jgi:hypothetical protein
MRKHISFTIAATPQSHGHERRHGMFIRHTCHSRKRELLLERAAGLRRAETGRD